ncbi:hypothetical protein ACT7DP_22095 [Bacillus paranthracis]
MNIGYLPKIINNPSRAIMLFIVRVYSFKMGYFV